MDFFFILETIMIKYEKKIFDHNITLYTFTDVASVTTKYIIIHLSHGVYLGEKSNGLTLMRRERVFARLLHTI